MRLRRYAACTLLVVTACAAQASPGGQSPAPRPAAAAELAHPAPAGARLPRLAPRPGGGFVLSWVEPAAGKHVLMVAESIDGRWSQPVEVARGEDWFINWIDVPSVVPVDSRFWVAHWLIRRPGGDPMDYDIAVAISTDGGRQWGGPRRPYASATAAQHGFVSIYPDGDAAGIAWIDGRDYSAAGGKGHAGHSGSFQLRHARVHRDGRIEPDAVIDPDVCSCCQTAPVTTKSGPVLAYRGHAGGEIRDNQLALRQGAAWRPGAVLGGERWSIAACPTNGPSLAGRGDELVAAWFTAAGGKPRVRAAFSADAGRTVREPVDVDNRDPVGRLGVARLEDGTSVVAWIGAADPRTAQAPLLLRTLDREGVPGPVRTIGRVSSARDTGILQVVLEADRLVIAWALPRPGFGIRAVSVPVKDLVAAR